MSADRLTIDGTTFDRVPVECPECGSTVDAQIVAYFGVCPADRCRGDRDAFEADAMEDADL